MEEKEMVNVTIEEYIPEKEEQFVEAERGKFWLDSFYDPDRQIHFFLMREPEWIHMEPEKTYAIRFETYDDSDTYHYRMWDRVNENTVIVAEYYNNKWYTISEGHLASDILKIAPAEYVGKGYAKRFE